MIHVITDTEALLAFEQTWNSLFESDSDATPFQAFGYVSSAIDFCNDKSHRMHIICIKDDPSNRWTAIFPFFIDAYGLLTYINYRHTDFCLPIICKEYNNYNLYKELAEYINGNKDISGIRWENLPGDSQMLSVLKPHFRFSIANDINYYSTIAIKPNPYDKDSIDSFKYVQAKQRRNLRKTFSKICDSCDFKIFSIKNGHVYPETQIVELIDKMIDDRIRSKEYFSDGMLAFWKSLYDKGIIDIAMISENGNTESANFMYFDPKHNQYIKWIMLYRENSWNMKINIMLADYLYKNGGATINFARGIYDYKLVNFHPDVKPLFCLRVAKTKWGHFKNILATALHYSKPIVKSWMGR